MTTLSNSTGTCTSGSAKVVTVKPAKQLVLTLVEHSDGVYTLFFAHVFVDCLFTFGCEGGITRSLKTHACTLWELLKKICHSRNTTPTQFPFVIPRDESHRQSVPLLFTLTNRKVSDMGQLSSTAIWCQTSITPFKKGQRRHRE